MKFFLIIFFSLCGLITNAQQTLYIKITGKDKMAVEATIVIGGSLKGYVSDTSGVIAITFPANGTYKLSISAINYKEKEVSVTIPYYSDSTEIALEGDEHQMEEIIVQSTRTGRTIANVPTRVETIETEEIDEKTNMRPANVAMILHESTGIQVQQTSATSGNASIRLQGLDGRYTQLLKDGFANFGNFSSGQSVLEIVPLDLKQVEIIKGPASTLFGGGAIAGVINFISRTPQAKPEYNFIINQSNVGQSNIGGYASARGKKTGYTLLALYSRSNIYDTDNDGFTEIPRSDQYTLHPKLFIYPNDNTTIILGNNFTKEKRTGGDVQVIKDNADAQHQYFETNKTIRNISTLEFDRKFSGKQRLTFKQSFSVFDRVITLPSYQFAGTDYNTYTDVSYVIAGNKHALVSGVNFSYDRFVEKSVINNNLDNTLRTGGAYIQHTLDVSDKIKLESGLRVDISNYKNPGYSNTEIFILPRASLLVKYNAQWSTRIGAGAGYKTPTLFTEETETLHFKNLQQLNNVHAEKSYGATADVNFRTNINNEISLSLNHMVFYTAITDPLVLQTNTSGKFNFTNASKRIHSAGFETNAKFIYKENLKLFLGYTYTRANATYLTGNTFLALVPKSKLNSALIYEKENVIKIGLEAYFTGRQYLSNGLQTPAFSELGFMAEKIFKHFSLFVNFENFTDTRQSKYKRVVNGPEIDPTFDEIWTHSEGFIFNGGVKIKL